MAVVGAIRWDAWYASTGPAQSTARSLTPTGYQYRLPFFASIDATGAVAFNPTTATMSAEIAFAKAAKLDYWAFLLYDRNGSDKDIMAGYDLFQANPNKTKINWCMIRQFNNWGTTGNFSAQVAEATAQCQQSNYQKILTNRPLVYIYGGSSDITAYFGTNANFKTALDSFRTSVQAAGLGNPYIVVMAGGAATSFSLATALGADAISNYIANLPATFPGTFADVTAAAQTFWDSMKNTGGKIVPICQLGWDRRPRIVSPVKWELSSQRPYFGLSKYYTEGMTTQIAAHIKAAVDYTVTNAASCDGAVLAYAWNEFDEGGWLCPTLGDPSGGRCLALGAVL